METTATLPPIERALPNLTAWLAHFRCAPIPVLAGTAALVREFADHEDAVDAHLLAETIGCTVEEAIEAAEVAADAADAVDAVRANDVEAVPAAARAASTAVRTSITRVAILCV